MKIWLDDMREAPKGWVWLRRAEDLIALLEKDLIIEKIDKYYEVELILEVALDNDLGTDSCGKTLMEGRKVIDWIEANMNDSSPKITILTSNPVAREYMETVKRRLGQ